MAIQTTARGTKILGTETVTKRDVADKIYLLQPDDAPLLTFTNGLKNKKVTNSTKFEWLEDDLLPNVVTCSAADGTTTTTVHLDSTLQLRPGDILIAPSGEALLVGTVTDSTHIEVTRHAGDHVTAGYDIVDGTELVVAGNAMTEGSTYAEVRSTQKTPKSNYIQVFKDSAQITEQAAAIALYGGDERKFQKMKMLIEHKRAIEKAFLFGDGFEDTSGALVRRATSGLLTFISTNVTAVTGGVLSESDFETFLRTAFRYFPSVASQTKLMLACPIMVSAINFWAKNALQVSSDEKSFGVKIAKYRSGHGDLDIVRHWLLGEFTEFTKYNFVVDPANILYRYLPGLDTKIHPDTGPKSTSQTLDEVRTHCGLQVIQEKTHSLLSGMTGYAA